MPLESLEQSYNNETRLPSLVFVYNSCSRPSRMLTRDRPKASSAKYQLHGLRVAGASCLPPCSGDSAGPSQLIGDSVVLARLERRSQEQCSHTVAAIMAACAFVGHMQQRCQLHVLTSQECCTVWSPPGCDLFSVHQEHTTFVADDFVRFTVPKY